MDAGARHGARSRPVECIYLEPDGQHFGTRQEDDIVEAEIVHD